MSKAALKTRRRIKAENRYRTKEEDSYAELVSKEAGPIYMTVREIPGGDSGGIEESHYYYK